MTYNEVPENTPLIHPGTNNNNIYIITNKFDKNFKIIKFRNNRWSYSTDAFTKAYAWEDTFYIWPKLKVMKNYYGDKHLAISKLFEGISK